MATLESVITACAPLSRFPYGRNPKPRAIAPEKPCGHLVILAPVGFPFKPTEPEKIPYRWYLCLVIKRALVAEYSPYGITKWKYGRFADKVQLRKYRRYYSKEDRSDS